MDKKNLESASISKVNGAIDKKFIINITSSNCDEHAASQCGLNNERDTGRMKRFATNATPRMPLIESIVVL